MSPPCAITVPWPGVPTLVMVNVSPSGSLSLPNTATLVGVSSYADMLSSVAWGFRLAIAVASALELFAAFESTCDADADAVLVNDVAPVAFSVSVTDAEPPPVIVPRLHDTWLPAFEQMPWPDETLTKPAAAVNTSVSVTAVASLGPLFATTIE